ncbi:hypothetical protein DPMN_153958 [Dreissena polymorpha]|uniref:CCHC-type domain-containing protein n=1 Tax=Dreissena polymorpha TaxID=45954 RepID=A0A9D4FPU8_DREPO|nr:hypothetical protein DPMN_153958 [Dreissena polymorpha]
MGTAGDILRRLGPKASVQKVIQKFESTFGAVDTKETILRKFYASQQLDRESIAGYTSRVKEIYTQAIKLGGIQIGDEDSLKSVVYQGLKKEMKQRAAYKFDIISDYDKFKIELRKIEQEMKTEKPEQKKCNAAVNIDERKQTDMEEVKSLLGKLNSRIDILEKERIQLKEELRHNAQQPTYQQYAGQHQPLRYNFNQGGRNNFNRGGGGNNFNRGGGGRGDVPHRGQGRGNLRYQPRRPVASRTFTPTCYRCNEKGHMHNECPKV